MECLLWLKSEKVDEVSAMNILWPAEKEHMPAPTALNDFLILTMGVAQC